MKFKTGLYDGDKPVMESITWASHYCEKCAQVDIERSATFVKACALGSRLLMEELARRQAPVEKQKAAKVEKWAREAGCFQLGKSSKEFVAKVMKYK